MTHIDDPALNEGQRYALQSIVDKLENLFPDCDMLEYYRTAAMELGTAVGADHSFIGAVRNAEPISVETLAYYRGKCIQPNFSYELKSTPCEQVLDAGVCIYPDLITELFPDDQLLQDMMISGYVGKPLLDNGKVNGIVAALFMTPIRDPVFTEIAFDTVSECINAARTRHRT